MDITVDWQMALPIAMIVTSSLPSAGTPCTFISHHLRCQLQPVFSTPPVVRKSIGRMRCYIRGRLAHAPTFVVTARNWIAMGQWWRIQSSDHSDTFSDKNIDSDKPVRTPFGRTTSWAPITGYIPSHLFVPTISIWVNKMGRSGIGLQSSRSQYRTRPKFRSRARAPPVSTRSRTWNGVCSLA
jgi:hypothetical protein